MSNLNEDAARLIDERRFRVALELLSVPLGADSSRNSRARRGSALRPSGVRRGCRKLQASPEARSG